MTYDSKSEAAYAETLDALVKAKKIRSWQRQIPVQLTAHGQKICRIIPDFLVTTLDGRVEYHECKSKATATPIWRIKVKLFKAQFPDATYTVIWR